jgi:hypothetical protein
MHPQSFARQCQQSTPDGESLSACTSIGPHSFTLWGRQLFEMLFCWTFGQPSSIQMVPEFHPRTSYKNHARSLTGIALISGGFLLARIIHINHLRKEVQRLTVPVERIQGYPSASARTKIA